jgi:hypothetical protein
MACARISRAFPSSNPTQPNKHHTIITQRACVIHTSIASSQIFVVLFELSLLGSLTTNVLSTKRTQSFEKLAKMASYADVTAKNAHQSAEEVYSLSL